MVKIARVVVKILPGDRRVMLDGWAQFGHRMGTDKKKRQRDSLTP